MTETPSDARLILLPWPPSPDRYWRYPAQRRGPLCQEGLDFVADAETCVASSGRPPSPSHVSLGVTIELHPPSTILIRDIIPYADVALDTLDHVGLLSREQIDRLEIIRDAITLPGAVVVKIRKVNNDDETR